MKSKLIGATSSIPFTKEKLKKTDSARLDLIENNLTWLLVVGSIGFSLGIWGYKELSNRMDKLEATINVKFDKLEAGMNLKFDKLEADLNHKFEQQTAMLLQIIKTRK